MLPYNKNLKNFARYLRTNMTEAEKKLWSHIMKKQLNGLQFYRQKTIGNYIVDFYCPKRKLIIELDGGQHYQKTGQLYDKERDTYLNKLGLLVLRFSDREVYENIEGVLETILKYL